jgi:hypothetical protein
VRHFFTDSMSTRELLRVHAFAFNGRDVESLVSQSTSATACFRDGRWVGEGPEAVRRAILEEYERGDIVGRLMTVDGEPLLAEWSGPEGARVPTGAVRIQAGPTARIQEIRIDHDEAMVRRLVERAVVPS